MKTQDHARVLYAYLARITPQDLDEIVKARKHQHYTALNEGNRSQLDAMRETIDACETAIDNLIDHDRATLREIALKAAY
ncbi:hypothetical protein [Paraburkholderia hospita]|uniref:hypothetical protein n=1 Tax=Paraburkholderia hospita TaxID=169430 RepID=UPI0008A722F6|nr:hypothetical protein [Paraburkholderia hospita]SEH89454.1 hypothetical protein SAMN05192544_1011125 [Paraburkholderia hospita]